MVKKGRLEDEYLKYNPDMDLEGSGEKDFGHNIAENMIQTYGSIEKIPKLISEKNKEGKALKKENELEKITIFVNRANGMSLNPDAVFTNRDAKEMLMRELKGDKSYFSSFSDHRMGTLFRSTYYSALKKLKK
jgi:hypothetical protein